MATTSHMFMYSLTVQHPTAVTQAILGQFSGTKEQQIITASGSTLTIHRPDSSQGKITPIFSTNAFGIIRSLAPFRLAGSTKGMFLLLFKNSLVCSLRVRLSDSSSSPGSTVLYRTDPLTKGGKLPRAAMLIFSFLCDWTMLNHYHRLCHHWF